MSRRLFLFGIGGTGSRVIKSLIMLFASGCKLPGGVDSVVPMLIDPDTANGDLNRTKDILRLYQSIRKKIDHPDDFFCQEVKTIYELANNAGINQEHFQFKLDGTDNSNFKDYIGFNSLDDDSKNFLRLLYSEQNLASDLNVGFKGNPNMGSVVLDQFTKSEDFKRFAQVFTAGDVIFIVNSIFGGTGAAGFPLLLNTLRLENSPFQNSLQMRDAPVGAITFLPYFKVENEETSEINSETFEEKAKLALNYYNRSIIEEKKINTLYFIGLKGAANVYENHEGQREQRNNAHFLELAGALSIFDFCNEIENHNLENGRSVGGSQVKEFGIVRDTNRITFKDLDSSNTNLLTPNLTRFRFFSEYLNRGLPRAKNVARWTKNSRLSRKKTLLDKAFFESADYENFIAAFTNYFDEWIHEMDSNKPSFSPFKKIVSTGNSLDILNTGKYDSRDGFKYLDIENSNIIDSIQPVNSFTQFFKLFGNSTKNVLGKYNLLKV